MTRSSEILPMPWSPSREPHSLLSVDRAVSELRRGRMVVIGGHDGGGLLMLAAEAATPAGLAELAELAKPGHMTGGRPAVAITTRRATVLGLNPAGVRHKEQDKECGEGQVALVTPADNIVLTAPQIAMLADPTHTRSDEDDEVAGLQDMLRQSAVSRTDTDSCEAAAVLLAKHARLLPVAVVVALDNPGDIALTGALGAWAGRHNILETAARDIFRHEKTVAQTLSVVSEARIPLADAENTRIMAFRPRDGGLEHLAIIIGEPETCLPDSGKPGSHLPDSGKPGSHLSDSADPKNTGSKGSGPKGPVLVRLHSECFTGDLLGSLKCDCGDQLRGAIAEISARGSGVLLYLAQEGRGIGLVNKLRAYDLQERGYDTLDANEQLGFDADERVYLPAAQMLCILGFQRISLMTNNPHKMAALSNCGVDVVERVPHAFPANKHNEAYLDTKTRRSGHLI